MGITRPKESRQAPNAAGNRVTEKLWHLTPAGLEAAAAALDRPVREMGGTAKAAAASGATHARKVTDTLAAVLQTPPEPMLPGPRTPTAPDAAPRVLAERPPGLGPLSAWTTEVTLPVAGTFAAPARGFLRADLVYALPGARPELLFVEVDNGTESPEVLADKVARYAAFFKRPADPRRPAHASPGPALWHTVWPHAAPEHGRRPAYPPVAVVFTQDTGP